MENIDDQNVTYTARSTKQKPHGFVLSLNLKPLRTGDVVPTQTFN